jgi:hypothetical protein
MYVSPREFVAGNFGSVCYVAALVQQYIKKIRAASTQEEREAIVQKELAKIRQKYSSSKKCSGAPSLAFFTSCSLAAREYLLIMHLDPNQCTTVNLSRYMYCNSALCVYVRFTSASFLQQTAFHG